MKDSKKNSAPIAPTTPDKANASGLNFKTPSAEPKAGTLVKKGHSKSVDPAKSSPAPASRKNVLGQRGIGGARYGVRVKFQKSVAPEAGATQGNGRMFSPAILRQRPNFQAGSADLE
jgi:hypothetical protein